MRRVVMLFVLVLLACRFGMADTRVIVLSHVDGFLIGEEETSPKDEEHVYWIDENRLQLDQGDHSFIVRRDMGVLLFVDHADQSYCVLELPIVREELIPVDVMEMLSKPLTFKASVSATEESKEIRGSNTQGYDVVMTSPVLVMEFRAWATADVPFDAEAFNEMYENVVRLQFSFGNFAEEVRKIDGFVVAEEGTIDMPTVNVMNIGMKGFTKQIDEIDPPKGTYIPPAGYVKKPFNFMAMFERVQ